MHERNIAFIQRFVLDQFKTISNWLEALFSHRSIHLIDPATLTIMPVDASLGSGIPAKENEFKILIPCNTVSCVSSNFPGGEFFEVFFGNIHFLQKTHLFGRFDIFEIFDQFLNRRDIRHLMLFLLILSAGKPKI
ncbi:MAG: Uncharacterised protein [Flavobacteriia bacterium]|nr:MAG: Uncharacterised protein [Flavobacteriia bacterium]